MRRATITLLAMGLVVACGSKHKAPAPPAPDTTVTTLAGTGAIGQQDGPFSQATFSALHGLALDDANHILYVADGSAIRKLDLVEKVVTTLAGGADAGFADGKGSAAMFGQAMGLALTSDGLLVSDGKDYLRQRFGAEGQQNERIRHVAFDGTVTTVAGDGDAGYLDGPAAQAEFDAPEGIWADSNGGLFIADLFNYRIRYLDASGVSTFAGGGPIEPPRADDGGSGWLADLFGLPPRHLGITAEGTSNGQFELPMVVVGDGQGNLLVGDLSDVQVVVGGSIAEFPAAGQRNSFGSGAFVMINALAWGPKGLIVGDQNCVQQIDGTGVVVTSQLGGSTTLPTQQAVEEGEGTLTTLAGSQQQSDFQDGPGKQALFNWVMGLAVDGAGNIYVSDTFNYRIRMIAPP